MRVCYSPHYYADIGSNHVFPIRKFEVACQRLLADETISHSELFAPRPVSIPDLILVHTQDYVTRLRAGALTEREIRRLGLPWSKSLVRRSFLTVSGTCHAARFALVDGIGCNLAGGTHHAFADRGEGFCVFNDVAVAARVLQRDNLAKRVAIVDCDVHQGNGTATIFAQDSQVFTYSMHGAKNYPLFKAASTLDVELPDNTADDDYLNILGENLPRIFSHQPDIIFYLAGADPYENDKLGRLKLTVEGLRLRDELVISEAQKHGIPLVTTMSGGYAEDIMDTVEIHCQTIRTAKAFFG